MKKACIKTINKKEKELERKSKITKNDKYLIIQTILAIICSSAIYLILKNYDILNAWSYEFSGFKLFVFALQWTVVGFAAFAIIGAACAMDSDYSIVENIIIGIMAVILMFPIMVTIVPMIFMVLIEIEKD